MLQAKSVGLTNPGYAFLTYELLLDSCLPSVVKPAEQDACDSLDGILDISLFVPEDESYKNFSKLVRKKMAEEPFNRVMSPMEVVSNFKLLLSVNLSCVIIKLV